ncbi:MAG: hypothetical protein ABIS07_02835, partial [Dokdonella sp.]
YPGSSLVPLALLEQPGGHLVQVYRFVNNPGNCPDAVCIELVSVDAAGSPLAFGDVKALGFSSLAGAAVDSNGRIVVAGTLAEGLNGEDFGVVRFNVDGSSDTGFAGGGVARVDFLGAQDHANALALDRQDNIIVVGGTHHTALDQDFAVVRLLGTDGSPDPAFADNGRTHIGFDLGNASGSLLDVATTVAIGNDARIVVAGFAYDNTIDRNRIGLARLDPDGSPDTHFCDPACNFMGAYSAIHSGRRVYYFGDSSVHEDQAWAIEGIPNGDFFIAGTSYAVDYTGSAAAVARLDLAGNYVAEHLDARFGDNAEYRGVRISDADATRVLLSGDSRPAGAGHAQNFVLVQAFSGLLAPLANYGDCLPDSSALCFDYADGQNDWGQDSARSLELDHLGRPLLSAAIVPFEAAYSNALFARFTNDSGTRPDPVFRNGFN